MKNQYKEYISQTKVLEILKRVKKGEYVRDLAKEYNLSYPTIKYWCYKAGIKVNKMKRKTFRDWDFIKKEINK